LKTKGTQASLLDEMQTRAELYELIQYEKYTQFDKDLHNSKP
jgi:methylisocitrate lyase